MPHHTKSKSPSKNSAIKNSKLKKNRQKKIDRELDRAGEDSFPASDPSTRY